ncbi:hypothetical protein NHX12_004037 [Muraenolepis orangiensis]|uniref:VWFC domain-containing protein n=1 Tax=Muraenolepis orangiensis TaxID=630683 RepID=A0A9Q0IDT7_9TELE|nr:hypothetical protein NHX12_004037 [Muraenolepis orangiensis]
MIARSYVCGSLLLLFVGKSCSSAAPVEESSTTPTGTPFVEESSTTPTGPPFVEESSTTPTGTPFPCILCAATRCEHAGRTFAVGETIKTSPCEECVCKPDGSLSCRAASCRRPVPCVDAVVPPGKCCPECPRGPNCYLDQCRTQVIPAYKPYQKDCCTTCMCVGGSEIARCISICIPERPGKRSYLDF